MNQFLPLHNHSHFSIRDAINTIPEIVKTVKDFNYPGFALTEHGTLASAPQAFMAAKAANLKFVPGLEAYVAPRHRYHKDPHLDRGYYHLCLYALDNEAYKALCYLVTESNKPECFYYKPRIDHELLAEFGSKYNIACSSGCLASELARSILKWDKFEYDGEDKAVSVSDNFADVIDFHKKVFKDRYYLEIHNHGIPAEDRVAEIIMHYAKEFQLKIIFATDAHYISPEDQFLHDVMLAIKENKHLDQVGFDGKNHCFLDYNTLKELAYSEEYLVNTMEIFERSKVNFAFDELHMPSAEKKENLSQAQILYQYCEEALKKKFNNQEIPKDYTSRLEREFGIISNMGFSGYFLIVRDYISWAEKNDIYVGPGRGSAGASLIAYLLGITKLDPVQYPILLFDRFLNESRAPKLDLQFNKISKNNDKWID